MQTGFRYLTIISLAVFITLSSFYLMHRLIDQGPGERPIMEEVVSIHFGPVEIPERPSRTPKPPPELPEPVDPPPPVDPIAVTPIENPQLPVTLDPLPTNLSDRSGVKYGIPGPNVPRGRDADARPKNTITPPYPRRQAMAGIEGWVRLSVVVDANGLVRSARVLESSPPRVFDDAAIQTVERWTWEPRLVAGRPVEQTVIQTIDFKLD